MDVWRSLVDKRAVDGVSERPVVTQEQVVGVLSVAVSEVIEVVSGDGVVQVQQGTHLGSLSGSGVVGLQGTGTRVGVGHSVGIVGPEALEK